MNQLRGYTEIEWAGKTYPFKFGTNAWALFCQERGIEFGDIPSTGVFGKWEGDQVVKAPDMLALLDLYYCGYVAACRSVGEKPITKEALVDILDELPDAALTLQVAMLRGKLLGFSFTEEGEQGNPQ